MNFRNHSSPNLVGTQREGTSEELYTALLRCLHYFLGCRQIFWGEGFSQMADKMMPLNVFQTEEMAYHSDTARELV